MWADTSCSGKHAHVLEFIEGKTVTATGFSSDLGSLSNLPIANVAYAHDLPSGETIILQINNTIYLGSEMDGGLLNSIQCMENNVHVDLRPRKYYPKETEAQTLLLPDNLTLNIQYQNVTPFIPVRSPTPQKLNSCHLVEITSHDSWDPHDPNMNLSSMPSANPTSKPYSHCNLYPPGDTTIDCIPLSLDCNQSLFLSQGSHISMMKATQRKDHISPEDLSRLWNIGLKTAERTLKATTHQCIKTTGILTRRFRADRAHLRYKQLATHLGDFYVDTLKSSVKSICGYFCGNIYTNRIGFKKFYPMSSFTSAESTATLQPFIHLVGSRSLHSDNHKKFKEGDFKRKTSKFHIPVTFTEPHSPWQNRAEYAIGEVKSYARQIMQRTQTPI